MKFINKLKIFKNKLTRLGTNEPLNFFSIVLIIALDIFVLVNLFQGLDLQTKQLESPRERIPSKCVSLINSVDQFQNVKNILRRQPSYYSNVENKYSAGYVNQKNKEKIEPQCREIFDTALELYENRNLQQLYSQSQNLEKQKDTSQSQIYQYENNYDTMLLEEIADQNRQDSIVNGKMDDVKEKIADQRTRITKLETEIAQTNLEIEQSADVKNFLALIDTHKTELKSLNKKLTFWSPVKKTGVQLIFLLPLLLVFVYFYYRSLKKNRELLILIFAHLLVVVSIPIFFEVFHMLFDILPFHILEDLLELLEAMNLVVIWNYLLILIGIGVALGLIYLVQKKLFSRQRMYLKRIAKGKCLACGMKINANTEYCYNCGEKQVVQCPHCSKLTYKTGVCCVNCGKKLVSSD